MNKIRSLCPAQVAKQVATVERLNFHRRLHHCIHLSTCAELGRLSRIDCIALYQACASLEVSSPTIQQLLQKSPCQAYNWDRFVFRFIS